MNPQSYTEVVPRPALRLRLPAPSTPVIVVGSLLAALGLTAFTDTQARAQHGLSAGHARLLPEHDGSDLRILDWALWNVSKYYVDPDRIKPQDMTLAGLEAIESEIPEVLVEPTADGKRVRVRVGTAEQAFDVGDVEALWSVGTHIREVFRFVGDHTELSEEQKRVTEYAIVGRVLATLDPHTNLLRPEDFEDMKATTKGSFGGLGIEVGMRDGGITVIRVIDGNPASKVDMRPGDKIVRIDDESTVTLTLTEAVSRLRGAPGTTVTVYVMRDGLKKAKPLKVTRSTIELDSVVGHVLTRTEADGKVRKVGLVQIPRNFAATTGKELRTKLAEFEGQGVEGVVLDLRDNPGGLLNAAVEVADAFVDSGTIVSTVGRGAPREDSRADTSYQFPRVPLVVLADQGSASASEIVAGALRNLGRAVVIGRRTFGKGSVQVLHERKVGAKELALKLTIAQYLTPGDVSIQSVGVSPDLETLPVQIQKDYVSYFGRGRFDLLREESLASHLESDRARAQTSPYGPLYFLSRGSLKKDAKKKAGGKEADARTNILLDDPEIRVARDLVLWAPSSDRDAILGKLDEFVNTQQGAEEKHILNSLAVRDIDWTAGTKPAEGTGARLRVDVRSNKPKNTIAGGEDGTVTVTVTNEGNAPAYQVRAITESDYRYFDERELIFGRIDPGKARTYDVKLSVGEHELSRTDRIDLHFFEQFGAKLSADSATSIDISAEGLSRPHFSYGYQVLDDPRWGKGIEGNGDGVLQVGERVRLRVSVKNTGDGKALDTWVNLRNRSGDAVFIHTGRENLKELATNQVGHAELDLEVKRTPDDGDIRLQITVSDNKIAEVLSETVVFPIQDGATTFGNGPSGVTAKGQIDLYASPVTQRIVARGEAGTYKATGKADGWYRVDLGDAGGAFVRAEDVEVANRRPAKSPTTEPLLAVSPPRIKLIGDVTQTDQESLHISGTATDDEAVRDVYITVYNPARNLFGDREKVFYQASADPASGKLEFAADVPLTPGNNLIEINAREDEDVIGVKRMWVLRTSGLAEARAKKDKGIESRGRLRVDSFK